jgi:very-short-patch-repair endonuclease
MHHLIFFLPLIVAGFVILGLIGVGSKVLSRLIKADRSEYQAVPLLSAAEVEFFRCLESICGASVLICPKVRLADLVLPRKGLDRSKFQIAFNRVSAKHVDFVLLRSEDLGVFGVVELDDRSHERQDRQDRDGLVDNILSQAGIPVCRVKAQSRYDLEALRGQLEKAFDPHS